MSSMDKCVECRQMECQKHYQPPRVVCDQIISKSWKTCKSCDAKLNAPHEPDCSYAVRELIGDKRGRIFHKGPIFMGGGSFTARECKQLEWLLSNALSHLSGIQQPSRMCDPEDSVARFERESALAETLIRCAVRDIAMALTGCNITFEAPDVF